MRLGPQRRAETSIPVDVKPVECPRCSATILAGWVDGMFWRADPYRVSVEDATLLTHYGTVVLLVDWFANKWLANVWHPGQFDLARSNRYLIAPHACGSAHARGETP